jgi:hypothetical protein
MIMHGDQAQVIDLFAPVFTGAQATPAKRRVRRPTLASVARQAAKAGIEVAGYEVRPDGTIGIITGKPVETKAEDEIDGVENAAPIDPRWN